MHFMAMWMYLSEARPGGRQNRMTLLHMRYKETY